MMGLFDEVPTEAHRRLLETNLFGTMYGAKAAITQFRRQGRGVLVNVCSLAGKTGYRYGASYCASKFAVRGLGECLRQDLLGTGIHVATVFPATIDTPLFDHAANFTGRRLVAMNPVYAVDRVARAVVSAARQPRREVVVGGMPRLSAIPNVVAPGLFERVYARMVDRKHFSDTPAVRTAGNLFAPMGSTEETGGWRRLAPRVALGALAATALGALAWKAAPRLRAV
jgi:short-subunit dehydrogenase